MKKTNLKWAICALFIVVAVSGMMIFALGGKKESPVAIPIQMDGTWLVVSDVNDGELTLIDNEYIVFEQGQVEYYRDNSEIPFAKSTFSVEKDILNLPDISRKYHISTKTQNYIAIYSDKNSYKSLVRTKVSAIDQNAFDPKGIIGQWNIVYRNTDQVISEEYLLFDGEILSDYRNGKEEPVLSAKYEWKGNHIIVDAIGKDMVLKVISKDEIALVETDTGFIWELKKENRG